MSIIFYKLLIGTWCTSSHTSCTCSTQTCAILYTDLLASLPNNLSIKFVLTMHATFYNVFALLSISHNASLNDPAWPHHHTLQHTICGSLKPGRSWQMEWWLAYFLGSIRIYQELHIYLIRATKASSSSPILIINLCHQKYIARKKINKQNGQC
jgi:hypothetical protein